MNIRQISEQIRDHLTQQKKIASAELTGRGMSCAYRGDDGTMCAVGCLIKDEHYDNKFEGKNLNDLGVMHAIEKSLGVTIFGNYDIASVLSTWQYYHDSLDKDESSGLYKGWINDHLGAKSPAEFHDSLMEAKGL